MRYSYGYRWYFKKIWVPFFFNLQTKPIDEEEIIGGYIKEQSHDKNDQKDPER